MLSAAEVSDYSVAEQQAALEGMAMQIAGTIWGAKVDPRKFFTLTAGGVIAENVFEEAGCTSLALVRRDETTDTYRAAFGKTNYLDITVGIDPTADEFSRSVVRYAASSDDFLPTAIVLSSETVYGFLLGAYNAMPPQI